MTQLVCVGEKHENQLAMSSQVLFGSNVAATEAQAKKKNKQTIMTTTTDRGNQ